MRKRAMLFAAPLLVVAIAASVAVAAPSDAEYSGGPKLDKLHAERPIAASTRSAHTSNGRGRFRVQAKAIQDWAHFQVAQRYVNQVLLGQYLDAIAAADVVAPVAAPAVSSAVHSDTNPGDFLSCVRNRESGGNYGVYNEGGSGASGAYQFLPGTWNSVAESVGRGDLVGVTPAQAAPADQDAIAQALYAQQGAAPWGGGC